MEIGRAFFRQNGRGLSVTVKPLMLASIIFNVFTIHDLLASIKFSVLLEVSTKYY